MKIRPEIIKFAEAMELKMKEHDPEKGDSWKNQLGIKELNEFLIEEIVEYLLTQYRDISIVREIIFAISRAKGNLTLKGDHEYGSDGPVTIDPTELIDSGNALMMVWNKIDKSKVNKNDGNQPI